MCIGTNHNKLDNLILTMHINTYNNAYQHREDIYENNAKHRR